MLLLVLSWNMPGQSLPAQGNRQEVLEQLSDEYRPGLKAIYQDSLGNRAERIDAVVAFQWSNQSPDTRLSSPQFKAVWSGFLFVQSNGTHTLFADCQGQVEIEFQQRTITERDETTGLISSGPLNIPFGWHPITVRYQSTHVGGALKLYWQGPAFQLEPVGYQFLYHASEESVKDDYRQGEHLVHALRCARCHQDVETADTLGVAPDLKHARDYLKPTWISKRLQRTIDPNRPVVEQGSRMPAFGFSREQAESITAYLFQASTNPDPEGVLVEQGDVESGLSVFASVGCVACHQAGDLGKSTLFDGGRLDLIGSKRTDDFWQRWFQTPQQVNAHHRMPKVELSDVEQRDVIAYLKSLGTGDSGLLLPPYVFDEDKASKGQQLYKSHGCANCHEDKPATKTMAFNGMENQGCFQGPDVKKGQPGYSLSEENQQLITLFLKQMKSPTADSTQSLLVAQNNCLQCHGRMDSPGLAAHLPDIGKQVPALADAFAALTPPSLNSVGDKLTDHALREAIERKTASRRPWLKVRMPQFGFRDHQLDQLAGWFIEQDRIPNDWLEWMVPQESGFAEIGSETLATAGARLVTSDGFGCTSCHQVGSVIPPKAPLNAKGPDLSLLDTRIRKIWFSRWVNNPARIIPRMEMPSVQIPVRGVLDNHLPHQIEAVWKILNTKGFEPPTPGAIRIARTRGVPEYHAAVKVLTDVLIHRDQQYIKPVLIGMRNRHNLLFDMQQGTFLGWWQGDIARQRTKGKTWYWETDGGGWGVLPHSRNSLPVPDFQMQLDDGTLLAPQVAGQFTTELDRWEQIPDGLRIRQRYRFQLDSQQRVVVIVQEFTEIWPADSTQGSSGIERKIWFEGVPPEASMIVGIGHSYLIAHKSDGEQMQLSEPGGTGRQSVHVRSDQLWALGDGEPKRHYQAVKWNQQTSDAALTMKYLSHISLDRFPVLIPQLEGLEPQALQVVPGIKTVRLPFSDEFMPTAIHWNPQGDLFITSLKGRIWQAVDTDGDGMEDRLSVRADELAAPYGIWATKNYVDVINKYALLRMFDSDRDGIYEQVETLASGWAHTADYHDWVVGLVPDGNGGYYISTPCQQDERDAAAAALRGKVLQLVPRKPTRENPQRFAVEVLSAGHRFPMGLARNRAGELFVTDNQGNYNPYNELNHIRRGAHYGFINLIDRVADSPRPELTAPAIDMPHPWTRSVNGICFLETPPAIRPTRSTPLFGPFEGHLIGCEYDTRRLIRMSLQKVGNTFQGAAYPFTLEKPMVGDPLLGPLAVAVSPQGFLYIASIRDSGWGGANNVGTLARMEFPEQLPSGIAEVIATHTGFKISFTQPVDRVRASELENYSIQSATRDSTTAYGGDDRDRRTESITAIEVARDRLSVELTLAEFREGFVYDIRIRNLAIGQKTFFPAEAYYTLRKVPAE